MQTCSMWQALAAVCGVVAASCWASFLAEGLGSPLPAWTVRCVRATWKPLLVHLVAAPAAAWVVLVGVCCSSVHLPGEGQAAVRVGVAAAALRHHAKLPCRLAAGHPGRLDALIGAVKGGPALNGSAAQASYSAALSKLLVGSVDNKTCKGFGNADLSTAAAAGMHC